MVCRVKSTVVIIHCVISQHWQCKPRTAISQSQSLLLTYVLCASDLVFGYYCYIVVLLSLLSMRHVKSTAKIVCDHNSFHSFKIWPQYFCFFRKQCCSFFMLLPFSDLTIIFKNNTVKYRSSSLSKQGT